MTICFTCIAKKILVYLREEAIVHPEEEEAMIDDMTNIVRDEIRRQYVARQTGYSTGLDD